MAQGVGPGGAPGRATPGEILPAGVLVVGTGLLGTSVALALRQAGIDVRLRDVDPAALSEAVRRGAGRADGHTGDDDSGQPASLAVVAVPPEITGDIVAELIATGAAEYVTDVASVKVLPARRVRELTDAPGRYIGSHPMAGREVSGPAAALPDLFVGRPWVLCPDEDTDQQAVTRALAVARLVGAAPITMPAADHDAAVALVSHAPHLVSALMAARLSGAPGHEVRLAGPGVTDVTRIAAGDPVLWSEILTANAVAVGGVLRSLRQDLDGVLAALDAGSEGKTALRQLLATGVDGRARLPGKHGAPQTEFVTVAVVVDDRPGQLAALFADTDAAGVNIEDVRIEHSAGQSAGLVELDVRPGAEDTLDPALRERGWQLRGA